MQVNRFLAFPISQDTPALPTLSQPQNRADRREPRAVSQTPDWEEQEEVAAEPVKLPW